MLDGKKDNRYLNNAVTDREQYMRVGSTAKMRRLRAALALNDQSLESWSAEQGVSPVHVYYIMRGDRQSPRVEEAAEKFADRMGIPHVRDRRAAK